MRDHNSRTLSKVRPSLFLPSAGIARYVAFKRLGKKNTNPDIAQDLNLGP
jgi:hypothetical protein